MFRWIYHASLDFLAAAFAVGFTHASLFAGPPNIVVILSDDMGYSDLGCFGGEIQTPNLDRLAANGLRFTQFYNSGRCCPTRASLLTGLYPHQAGVGHMTEPSRDSEGKALPGYRGNLNAQSLTIAEVLRRAGYRTYMSGKWHVSKHSSPSSPKDAWPIQRGFDKFYGTLKGACSYYDPSSLMRHETFVSPFSDSHYNPPQYYYTDAISDNAVDFIRQHQADSPGRPFFLYLSYTAAHWPLHARQEDIAKYKAVYDKGYQAIREARYARLKELGLVSQQCLLSPNAGEWNQVKNKAWETECMKVYAAMVDCMDQGIGRVVTQIEESGYLDNTVIFYLQDNGGCSEALGRQEQGDWGKHELWRIAGLPMHSRSGTSLLCKPDRVSHSLAARTQCQVPTDRTCPTALAGRTCRIRHSASTRRMFMREVSPPRLSSTGRQELNPVESSVINRAT